MSIETDEAQTTMSIEMAQSVEGPPPTKYSMAGMWLGVLPPPPPRVTALSFPRPGPPTPAWVPAPAPRETHRLVDYLLDRCSLDAVSQFVLLQELQRACAELSIPARPRPQPQAFPAPYAPLDDHSLPLSGGGWSDHQPTPSPLQETSVAAVFLSPGCPISKMSGWLTWLVNKPAYHSPREDVAEEPTCHVGNPSKPLRKLSPIVRGQILVR